MDVTTMINRQQMALDYCTEIDLKIRSRRKHLNRLIIGQPLIEERLSSVALFSEYVAASVFLISQH